VTEPLAPQATAATPAFRGSRLAFAAVVGLLAHVVVFAAAFVAARSTTNADGFRDLAALATVLVLGEGTVFLVSVVAAVVLVARGRRDLAIGLAAGWLAGAVAFWLLVWSA
jgi:hypothetical protein